ncbi:MAG: hypothetical protein KJO67_11435, partial [Silicimonas sp.]|nr:hypothetical protein [Silicimonas sp.]
MTFRDLVKQALLKPGLTLGFAFLAACFLTISGFFIRQYDDFVRQRTTFLGLNMREGFVALSDLQRINLIVLEAIRAGEMGADHATRLDRATDFLFVRAN